MSASQALSSETSIQRLHARVAEVLGAMTGATAVHLVLWDDGRQAWLQPAPGGTVPAGGTGHQDAVPASVLRYVQRTGEPLVQPTPRATTGSPATPTSPGPGAARCWPCRSSAAARYARCWWRRTG